MSVYFIANIHIHDDGEYEKYRKDVDEVFSRYRGEYLALDDAPVVLEGDWDYTRAVLIRFPDREALDAWYFSPEYQRILQHRLKGARCDTIVIEGN